MKYYKITIVKLYLIDEKLESYESLLVVLVMMDVLGPRLALYVNQHAISRVTELGHNQRRPEAILVHEWVVVGREAMRWYKGDVPNVLTVCGVLGDGKQES